MRHLPFLLLILSMVIGCKPSVPSRFIQPDAMEDLLYDLHLFQSLAQNDYDNEMSQRRHLYYQATFAKHGVTAEEFDSSMVWYYTNAEELHTIYQHVAERLEQQSIMLGNNNVSYAMRYQSSNGDTTDIWTQSQFITLLPIAPYNRFDFTIKADSTFRRGDSFVMALNSNFVYQQGTKDAAVCVAVDYEGDSTRYFSTTVQMSGVSKLRIPGDHHLSIRQLRGYIYLDRGSDDTRSLKLLFINDIHLARMHRTSADSLLDARADSIAALPKDSVKMMRPYENRR